MIASLNLLPWREEKRKQHKQRFFSILGAVVIVVATVQWLLASYFEQHQMHQQIRNQQLQQEISTLSASSLSCPSWIGSVKHSTNGLG